METTRSPLALIRSLADRLRPTQADDVAEAENNFSREIALLEARPGEAAMFGEALRGLLALPCQSAFFAETGVRSALGSWLELTQRIGHRLLPPAPDDTQLRDVMCQIFHESDDHEWVAAVADEKWLALANILTPAGAHTAEVDAAITGNILEAIRMLSYVLAGTALDRELLRSDPALERYESPFLAQNAALIPLLERARTGGAAPTSDEVRDIDVLLDQCGAALDRVRRKAVDNGISIRLTYLLARLGQIIQRQRELLDLLSADDRPMRAVGLLKVLLIAEQAQDQIAEFIGENVSLLARNITDHASRQGEHYIAEDRAAWWAMGRSAAGGGIIIAIMAMLKMQLALLNLPPLTEGFAFGLNYAIGFVLIHLLGFVVATKQPAMTAAAIAATLEEARPRELERLADLAQNVFRTQFIAVLGNVGLALPVACLIALAWPLLFGMAPAPEGKLAHMLEEVHPLHSAALYFAAVAGVGLFLSGLVSGYFDNRARYHQLAQRIASAPRLAWLGAQRAARLGDYLDIHYGAILGNLFFGMYLGLVGVMANLTGLPVDVRHVTFVSANLGTAVTSLTWPAVANALPWAIAGVIGIALINVTVSFALALYVAMKSRKQGAIQIARLTMLLLRRFVKQPLAFFSPPKID